MAAADFDDDGILDVAITDWEEQVLYVVKGNGSDGRGNGTFDCTNARSFPAGARPNGVAAGDFYEDGVTDLVVTLDLNADNSERNELLLFRGTSSGGHADGDFIAGARTATGHRPIFVDVADFNEDNIDDLLVVNLNDSEAGLSVYLGSGECR